MRLVRKEWLLLDEAWHKEEQCAKPRILKPDTHLAWVPGLYFKPVVQTVWRQSRRDGNSIALKSGKKNDITQRLWSAISLSHSSGVRKQLCL